MRPARHVGDRLAFSHPELESPFLHTRLGLVQALGERLLMLPEPHFVYAFGLPQGGEWIIVLIIALLLFGSKLPAMMRGMGGSIKEFKKGMEEGIDLKSEPKKLAPEAPEGAVSRDAKISDSK